MKLQQFPAVAVLVLAGCMLLVGSMNAALATSGPVPPAPPPGAGPADAAIVPSAPDLIYHALPPCRAVDTRSLNKPALSSAARNFQITGRCGVPSYAKTVTVNATAISPASGGFIRAWAAGAAESNTILNFQAHLSLTSAPVLPIGSGGAIRVRAALVGGGSIHFALDLVGYSAPALSGTFTSSGALQAGTGRLTAYSHNSTGVYGLKADQDLSGCAAVGSAHFYSDNLSVYIYKTFVFVEMTSTDGLYSDDLFSVTVTC